MRGEHPARGVSDRPFGFLARLAEGERRTLEAMGRRRRYARGQIVFHEGDPSDRAVVILRGRVKVSCLTEEGREVLLGVRAPGDLLGELSVLDGEPRSATATALEQLDVLLVPADGFRGFLEAHPRATMAVLETVAGRLRDADRKRIEFAALDTVGRVARRLVEMAGEFGRMEAEGVRIALPLSQQELAGWTGASREAVSKALGALRSRGWIETYRRGITVHDLDALRRRAR